MSYIFPIVLFQSIPLHLTTIIVLLFPSLPFSLPLTDFPTSLSSPLLLSPTTLHHSPPLFSSHPLPSTTLLFSSPLLPPVALHTITRTPVVPSGPQAQWHVCPHRPPRYPIFSPPPSLLPSIVCVCVCVFVCVCVYIYGRIRKRSYLMRCIISHHMITNHITSHYITSYDIPCNISHTQALPRGTLYYQVRRQIAFLSPSPPMPYFFFLFSLFLSIFLYLLI